jgi:hypothetical protein
MSTRARITLLAATGSLLLVLASATIAGAAPIKLLPSADIGSGTIGSGPGEFAYPNGVASAPDGNIYVADQSNHRVQELTAGGEFLLMFGREVNATTGGDLCTAASKDTCKAGVEGGAPGQFGEPLSVSVDPLSGDLYVAEAIHGEEESGENTVGYRVQELTPEGQFILEIGEEVNETKDGEPGATVQEKNLCTQEEVAEEGVKCGGPAQRPFGDFGEGHGALEFADESPGDAIAVGGEHDLLYVGGAGRVEEFEPDGAWKDTVTLPEGGSAAALAVEQGTGTLFVVNESSRNVVRAFDPEGNLLKTIDVAPKKATRRTEISGIALDGQGHLAVVGSEFEDHGRVVLGLLDEASTGRELTSFTAKFGGAAHFDAQGQLYVASASEQQILVYDPVSVGELLTGGAVCDQGANVDSDVTFSCKLAGAVDPFDVPETRVWFDWGSTCALGGETGAIELSTVEEPLAQSETLERLSPNRSLCYQLVGDDSNVRAPEQLAGETMETRTPSVPPELVGTPSASFVTSSSVVLDGEVNPEHTNTTYEFVYAKACQAGEACPEIEQAPGAAHTAALESAAYGRLGVTLEARDLQPQNTYRFQLVARNEKGETAVDQDGGKTPPEGTFTTAPAASPQVLSGTATAVGATTATISGSVSSAGVPTTYSFELGVYEGADTQYGDVLAASAGAGSAFVEETLALSGLQPGTTYAYRLAIHSGYIDNGEGTLRSPPVLFTTGGAPVLLTAPGSLPLLAVPNIAFPAPGKAKVLERGTKKKQKTRKRKDRKAKSGNAKPGKAKSGTRSPGRQRGPR